MVLLVIIAHSFYADHTLVIATFVKFTAQLARFLVFKTRHFNVFIFVKFALLRLIAISTLAYDFVDLFKLRKII